MKASVAHYGDIAALVKACKHHHEKSSWKELQFNPVLVKRNLMNMVRNDGSDVLVVRSDTGAIEGLLLAMVDQFFMNKQLYATDVHFVCDSGGRELFRKFVGWAREQGAQTIIMGIANDDPDGRVARFYQAMGLRKRGDAWVMPLLEQQEKAA